MKYVSAEGIRRDFDEILSQALEEMNVSSTLPECSPSEQRRPLTGPSS